MATRSSPARLIISWQACLVLAGVFALTGCVSHVKDLREAQNHFNTAALLETQLRNDPTVGDALAVNTQAETAYQLSYRTVADLIANHAEELRQDNLLGTAYTLKALAEWRLGNYDAAAVTVDTVRNSKDIMLFPRDRALLTALGGLIKNDQAYRHMAARDYDYMGIKGLLLSSLDDLRGQGQGAEGLGVYLAAAKFAALKNWADLRGAPERYANAVPPGFDKREEIRQWCAYAVPAWKEFEDALKDRFLEKSDAIRGFWGLRLGMPETCKSP